jgi:hypothetical protein
MGDTEAQRRELRDPADFSDGKRQTKFAECSIWREGKEKD